MKGELKDFLKELESKMWLELFSHDIVSLFLNNKTSRWMWIL